MKKESDSRNDGEQAPAQLRGAFQAAADNLVSAIRRNDVGTVKALLASSVDPDDPLHPHGSSLLPPIIMAARDNRLEILEALLLANANPNAPDELGQTPLFYAAAHGRADMIDLLVKAEVKRTLDNPTMNGLTIIVHDRTDLNRQDGCGRTALFHAAENGQRCAVRRLLAAGAHIDVRDKNGMTALMTAVDHGKAEVAAELLLAGANPAAEDYYGVSSIEIAQRRGTDMKALLEDPAAALAFLEKKRKEELDRAFRAGTDKPLKIRRPLNPKRGQGE